MRLLVSIHPAHAEAILAGRKTVEFRKRWRARDHAGETIEALLYATAPTSAVVGMALLGRAMWGRPALIWRLAAARGHFPGIDRDEFDLYAGAAGEIAAIPVLDVHRWPQPMPLLTRPPQSWRFAQPQDLLG